MLDIAFIRQNPEPVQAAITNKRLELDVNELLAVDKERRDSIVSVDAKRARKNQLAAMIPKASKEERQALIDEAHPDRLWLALRPTTSAWATSGGRDPSQKA